MEHTCANVMTNIDTQVLAVECSLGPSLQKYTAEIVCLLFSKFSPIVTSVNIGLLKVAEDQLELREKFGVSNVLI